MGRPTAAVALLAVLALGAYGALPTAARADDVSEWVPIARHAGVLASARPVPGRSLPELRAVGEIPGGMYEVLAVIADVARHPEWQYKCIQARQLGQESDDVVILYQRTDSPWPVSDRDAIVRSVTKVLDEGRTVLVRFSTEGSPQLPVVPGVVRMSRLSGHYALRALGPKRTQVEFLIDADPGGSLPSWLVGRTARELPLVTFIGLRRQVEATRGQYEPFLARWDPDHEDAASRE
jgi:hypothetical protein